MGSAVANNFLLRHENVTEHSRPAWRTVAFYPQRARPRHSWSSGKRCGVAANLGGADARDVGRKLKFCNLAAAHPRHRQSMPPCLAAFHPG